MRSRTSTVSHIGFDLKAHSGYCVQIMAPILRLLGTLVLALWFHTGSAQVIYETGVSVVTVVGQPGVSSDYDGTGDEVLLGETRGIAALGDTAFATSTFGGKTRLKRIVGRTVTTIAETNSMAMFSDGDWLTSDPVRQSFLWSRRDFAIRAGPTGQTVTILPFPPFCSIRSNSVAIPRDNGVWLLDLQSGNYSYLAGGSITTSRDGLGQLAGFANIFGTAMSDHLAYINDQSALRLVTIAGEVRSLAASGYVDGALPFAKASPSRSMVVDKDGNLIFAQQYSIRRLSGGSIKTLAGNPSNSAIFDGAGHNARFSEIQGLAVDNLNRLWIADRNCIRLLTIPESRIGTAPELGIRLVPSLTIRGEIGSVYRIEYQDAAEQPWQFLRLIVLSKSVEEVVDQASTHPSRIYRAVLPN